MVEIIIAVAVLLGIGYFISKRYNATVVLLIGGMILLFATVLLGKQVLSPEETTGILWLDPFKKIELIFVKNMGNVGLIIMMLFGFSTYMNNIGANEVTVNLMAKPLDRVKSKYILIPIIFLLGNCLSLVVPSAASLAVLLMATLFPVLTRVGVSPLAAGAVITTGATIMPTPLGADNVLAAEAFNVPLMDYVVAHAKISIPSIILMAIAHYFWQKHLDKKEKNVGTIKKEKLAKLNENLPPKYYAILPILPLILVLFFNLVLKTEIGLVPITIMSLMIAVFIEVLRKKDFVKVSNNINDFFKGMGNGLSMVVVLLVAASTLVEGLKSLGIINMLMESVQNIHGAGILLVFAFAGITAVIGFISGSGLAVFYAAIELIPALAIGVGINGMMISLPMQMMANLIRSVSPVAAAVIIVSSLTGTSPMNIVKRTSVPMIVGMISVLTLSILYFN
ncbi:MAG: C4-dicarboxylate transporter DcuC [Clostridium sp.]|uniref:C4-dicarboxylate transporter DcuC n=1 Tax=Clostridium sp. TaxID=1506 RepID=UPI003EE676C5